MATPISEPRRRARRRPLAGIAATLALALCGASDAMAAGWTLADHPAPPPGAPFKVPLGAPGDLQFIAPNRGLLSVEGNATIPRGLFLYDGASWRQLSTVCGGPADTTRIIWASPNEFWTITEPSLPRTGSGLGLCRFVGGEVVNSFSTNEQTSDPFRRLNAGACRTPNDCWFAGIASADPTGQRRGTFHLSWDGARLRSSYYPQDRAASDLEAHGDRIVESSYVGRRSEGRGDEEPSPELTEERPHLLHEITGESVVRTPFTAADLPLPDPNYAATPPDDATDLLALDSDGGDLWAVGGGTASGACPTPPTDGACRDETGLGGVYDRQPIAVVGEGTAYREVKLTQPFAPGERFVDVAAVPGANTAWVAVQRFLDRRSPSARAKVARLAPDGTVEETLTLPSSGSGRGAAAKIAFTGPNEGWMVTTAGWIFHFTDGTPLPRDVDPALSRLITFRPNEAAAQFVPDAPPFDDSRTFEPPPPAPIEPETQAAPPPKIIKLKRLMTGVTSKLDGKRRLVISFRLARKARIGITGRRRGRVVARAKQRLLKAGRRRSIRLKVDPRRYPTKLSFQVREPGVAPPSADDDAGAGAGDTVTTP